MCCCGSSYLLQCAAVVPLVLWRTAELSWMWRLKQEEKKEDNVSSATCCLTSTERRWCFLLTQTTTTYICLCCPAQYVSFTRLTGRGIKKLYMLYHQRESMCKYSSHIFGVCVTLKVSYWRSLVLVFSSDEIQKPVFIQTEVQEVKQSETDETNASSLTSLTITIDWFWENCDCSVKGRQSSLIMFW